MERLPTAPYLLLAALLAAASLACATSRVTVEAADVSRPVAERLSETQIRLRWPPSFALGDVRIYSSYSPQAIPRERPVGVASGPVELGRADGGALGLDRPVYFDLVPEAGGRDAIVGERRLPLQGADNFRDLGGYHTRDGRAVRWGMLFRSNDLSTLTRPDLDYLKRMRVRLVCDFRSPRERADKPAPTLEDPGLLQLSLPVAVRGVEPELVREDILSGRITAPGIERSMRRAYRSFVTDHAETWSALFKRLAQPGSLPTVVHCTAGKDRTGFAAALVLLALGVPQETVFEDYLLTNRYQEDYRNFVLRWVPLASLFRTDPEDLLPLLEARRVYLQSSIDAMVELHGSVEGYLEEGLGVGPELRAALERNLLRQPVD